MATQYSSRMPDMSRNEALAGQTVYTNGMNVTYNDQGYVSRMSNPDHSLYAGTTKSVRAQPMEDALAGKSWTQPDTSGLINWGDGTGMGWSSPDGYSTSASWVYGGTGSGYGGSGNTYAEQLAKLYGNDGYYSQQLAQMRAARTAATQAAVAKLNSQKADINNQYNDMYRQAYIDKMQGLKNINQSLAAQGVTGGATESTMLGLNSSYADALRKAEQERIGTIGDLDQAIIQTQATGDADVAQLAFDSAKERTDKYAEVLRDLMNREDSLSAKLAAQNASEQSSQQAWARQLATQLLAQGNMPDDETLTAAGISRAQADMLLAQPASGAGDVYTPTFSISQLQTELNNAMKYGTSLSPTLLRDYEYYYGAPYGGTGSSTYSAALGSSVGSSKRSLSGSGYDNGGYSNAEIQALQQWLRSNGYSNLAADGYWGPASQSTTGMSAKQAMAAMNAYLSSGGGGNYQSVYADLKDLKSRGYDNTTMMNVINNALQQGWISSDEVAALRNMFISTTR